MTGHSVFGASSIFFARSSNPGSAPDDGAFVPGPGVSPAGVSLRVAM
jgi:hypothetical protein